MNVLSLFDGKYEVTDGGDVFSNVGTRKKMIGKVTKSGYHMIVFNVDGKKLYRTVHRLVAVAFIPNPQNLPEVNHINGDNLTILFTTWSGATLHIIKYTQETMDCRTIKLIWK